MLLLFLHFVYITHARHIVNEIKVSKKNEMSFSSRSEGPKFDCRLIIG